jgi:GNAT superfamily N-acetyltransferase
MAVEIREAKVDEAPLIVPAYEWLFAPPGYRPEGWNLPRAERALKEAIESDVTAVLIAEDGGELIGLCTAYLDINSVRYGQRCWVEDLVVDPGRRSERVGAALLDAAEEWARRLGATHFELDTGEARTDAQRFYEGRGKPTRGFSYSWRL